MSKANRSSIHTGILKDGETLEVADTEYPKINDNQILIKAVAYAANPTDWKHAVPGKNKGAVAGTDASGVVIEVGAKVDTYQVGDIVSTFMHGNISPVKGAFSDYVVGNLNTTIKYDKANFDDQALKIGDQPADFINTFEGAAAVLLGLGTVGLSFHYNLGLKPGNSENLSKYILIWGGASSTGVLAIQLAKLVYGLKVITTASPKNHEFLKSLGADEVFNYRDPDVVEQIRKVGGANIPYALGAVSTLDSLQAVYDSTSETKEVHIDNLLLLSLEQIKTDESRNVKGTNTMVYAVEGVDTVVSNRAFSTSKELVDTFNDYWFNVLPQYITKIKHSNLKVLKPGLESASEALDLLRNLKVSGQKIVFRRS